MLSELKPEVPIRERGVWDYHDTLSMRKDDLPPLHVSVKGLAPGEYITLTNTPPDRVFKYVLPVNKFHPYDFMATWEEVFKRYGVDNSQVRLEEVDAYLSGPQSPLAIFANGPRSRRQYKETPLYQELYEPYIPHMGNIELLKKRSKVPGNEELVCTASPVVTLDIMLDQLDEYGILNCLSSNPVSFFVRMSERVPSLLYKGDVFKLVEWMALMESVQLLSDGEVRRRYFDNDQIKVGWLQSIYGGEFYIAGRRNPRIEEFWPAGENGQRWVDLSAIHYTPDDSGDPMQIFMD